jgi:protein-disulfide isomerase
MAQKRVEPGRGRKPGVVKSSKASSSNRAFYVLIVAVAVVGIAALTYQSTRSGSPGGAVANPIDTTLPPVQSAGYTIGNAKAPLEVTEFGDFECPACGNFSTITEPDVRKHYVNTGKVLWRFVDFPLSGHRNTWPASRAAACADEQGKFWEFHDALYQTQDQWNGEATGNPDKFMKQLGKQLGLNTAQFDQCVDSKKMQAKIQAHWALANARKVNQTPTFVIGDKQVPGALNYDQFAKMIDEALAKAPAVTPIGGDTSKKAVPLPAKKNGP